MALPTPWVWPWGPACRLLASRTMREGISVASGHQGGEKFWKVWNSLSLMPGLHGWLPKSAATAGAGEANAESSPRHPFLIFGAAQSKRGFFSRGSSIRMSAGLGPSGAPGLSPALGFPEFLGRPPHLTSTSVLTRPSYKDTSHQIYT